MTAFTSCGWGSSSWIYVVNILQNNTSKIKIYRDNILDLLLLYYYHHCHHHHLFLHPLGYCQSLLQGSQVHYIYHPLILIHQIPILECRVLGGDNTNNVVFIPCMTLNAGLSDHPIPFLCQQFPVHLFPVHLVYAMTINKSQDQTVKHVG